MCVSLKKGSLSKLCAVPAADAEHVRRKGFENHLGFLEPETNKSTGARSIAARHLLSGAEEAAMLICCNLDCHAGRHDRDIGRAPQK
jgi:hypothetical protein